jgi:plastocyanin
LETSEQEDQMKRASARSIALVFAVVLIATACSKKATPQASGGSSSTPPATSSSSGGDISGGGYGNGGGSSSSGGSTIPIGDDNANDHGKKDVSGVSSVNVEQQNAPDFYFSPTVLTGSAGQQLTIHLENKGTFPHTFTIDDQNIDVELQPGDEQDVQVTFASSGAVEFYCRFHHSMGMAGELLVA